MVCRHLFINILLSINVAYSQNDAIDPNFVRRTFDSTIAFYFHHIGENTLLYNGREYTENYSRTIGHPFYASEQPQKGNVVYDRILYPHHAISYDLVHDEVFIKTSQNISLNLLKEKIDQFSIEDHLFVRLNEQTDQSELSTGFYEVLHQSKIIVLAKRRKQLVPSFNLDDPYKFVHYDRYFVKINKAYHEILGHGSLVSLFPGHQKEIRKYIHQTGINFKKNPESAIVKVAEYFGGLKR